MNEERVSVVADRLSYGRLLQASFQKNDGRARNTTLTLTLAEGDDPRAVLGWLAEQAEALAALLEAQAPGDLHGNVYDAAGNLLRSKRLDRQGSGLSNQDLFAGLDVEPQVQNPVGIPKGFGKGEAA